MEPDWPVDAVEVGRVLGAWGVRGELKVRALSSQPEALFSSKRWYVDAPEAPIARPGAAAGQRLLRVVSAREHGDVVIARIQDLDDRDAAQALAGWRIHVGRASFPTPSADEYYWIDLIGCRVLNREGQDLGLVAGLVETGPHCVLRLESPDAEGGERMIPFVSAYVDTVDTAARRIVVDWGADY